VHQVLGETGDGDAVPDRRVLGDPYGMKDGKQRVARPRRGTCGSSQVTARAAGWLGRGFDQVPEVAIEVGDTATRP
jgi:hypothetical protein